MTADPIDDVVDNFSSLSTGVVDRLARPYNEPRWRTFFECLCFIYDLEGQFYELLKGDDDDLD